MRKIFNFLRQSRESSTKSGQFFPLRGIPHRGTFFNFLNGFTLIEMVVYVGVVVIIVSSIMIFGISTIRTGTKIKYNADILDSGRRAMEMMNYEIKKSKSVYGSTSVFAINPGQLSLEQVSTSTPGETNGFVDFFQCGDSLCLHRDGADPIRMIGDQIRLTNLVFKQLSNSTSSPPSIQIKVRLEIGTSSSAFATSSIDLSSAANLRGY